MNKHLLNTILFVEGARKSAPEVGFPFVKGLENSAGCLNQY
jgi:hypothetical protein